MKHLYGEFTDSQIENAKKSLRSSIFFLLLYVDKATCEEYKDVDIDKCFESLMLRIGGMNDLLMQPPELVTLLSLLQAARNELNKKKFRFLTYRKLILDACAEVGKIKGV